MIVSRNVAGLMPPVEAIAKAAQDVLDALDRAEASGLIGRELLRAGGDLRVALLQLESELSRHDDRHGTANS